MKNKCLPNKQYRSYHKCESSILALVKITLVNTYMCIYYCCVNLGLCAYLNVHMIIYTVIVHSRTIYMMLIGYANYVMLGVLVMCVWYTSTFITREQKCLSNVNIYELQYNFIGIYKTNMTSNNEYIRGQRCEGTNMAYKCNIFVPLT